MNSSDDVLSQAMRLPDGDRANIAHHLLLSLEPEVFSEDEVASAWQDEVESHMQKIADGNFKAHDWRDAIQNIRQDLTKEKVP